MWGAYLGHICTPQPGYLYCLLGSRPSRALSLYVDIRGKNWRTGSKLESLYRQESLITVLRLQKLPKTSSEGRKTRAASAVRVSELDKNLFFMDVRPLPGAVCGPARPVARRGWGRRQVSYPHTEPPAHTPPCSREPCRFPPWPSAPLRENVCTFIQYYQVS